MRQLRRRAGHRRWVGAGAGIALLLVVIACGSLPAAAAPSGSVSGVVRDPGGNPVEGICVTVQNGPGTRTGADGAYTIGELDSGTYALDFVDCTATPHFVEQWFSGHRVVGDADPVTVADGADTPLTDVTLERGVSIAGTVTGGGNPLAGMTIKVTPTSPGFPSGSAESDADGTYLTQPLPPGDYQVAFSDPSPNPSWAPQYWKQESNAGAADPVTLKPGDGDVHAGVDAPLTPIADAEATVEGTVRGEGGVGLVDICVSVEVPRNGGGFDWIAGANTTADGSYRIEHVTPGDVRVHFRDCNHGPYIEEWYDDQPTGEQAAPLQLTGGAVHSGIDATLTSGVMVSGRVVDPQGDPIPSINVNVNPDGSGASGWAQTDSDGRYQTSGLPVGSYRVTFQDQTPTPEWATQYWDGADTQKLSTVLQLTADDRPVRTGVDATMQPAASVAGHVYAPGGEPAANICVNAIEGAGAGPGWVGGTNTAPDGSYRISGLPPTSVRIMFQDCNGTGPYVTQWWPNQGTYDRATSLNLHPGSNRTGIDAHLAAAGTLRGTVTDRTGHPLEGICVQATAATFVGGLARTQSDGTYSLNLARGGTFKVQFVDCTDQPRYAGQWWDAATAANARTVTVAAGRTVAHIDAALARGKVATVSGRVVNVNGAAMTTVCVVVYLPNQYALFGMVEADGTFSVANVPSGTYALAFLGCAPNQEPSATVPDPRSAATSYPAVWWKGRPVALTGGEGGPDPKEQGADLVTLAPGQHASGYDVCFGCGAITIVSITPGHGELTIAFTSDLGPPSGIQAAAAGGGLTYTASCVSTTGGNPGTAHGTSSPITVTGLTPGAAYVCGVSASDDATVVATSSGAVAGVVLTSTAAAPAGAAPVPGESAASDPGSSMARTGTNALAQAAAGGTLLGLGGALMLVGRGRRRNRRLVSR